MSTNLGKFACTACGSRNWPRLDTECPLCLGNAADELEEIAQEANDEWTSFGEEGREEP